MEIFKIFWNICNEQIYINLENRIQYVVNELLSFHILQE